MLPAISDFIKDTLGESLKKPLQPSGLFAAAIFVFLNLFLVLSDFKETAPLIQAIFKLDTGWLVVLASVVTLILAYGLVSMSSAILRLTSGESWGSSPIIGRLLTAFQKMRLNALDNEIASRQTNVTQLNAEITTLKTQAATASGSARDELQKQLARKQEEAEAEESARLQLMWERETNFPIEIAYLAPTALGNILNAPAVCVWKRYQIDMTALWPHLETIIADKTALAERLNNAKATLDFLLNLAASLAAFGVEYLIVKIGLQSARDGLWCLVFWLLAYLSYRATWGRARAWGDAVQMAFDLHRDSLRQALKLREFKSQADEYEVWEKVSRWLLWGDRVDDVFANEPKPAASDGVISASSNVKVERVDRLTEVNERQPATGPAQKIGVIEKYVDYWLTINHATAGQVAEAAGSAATGVFVTVADPRVPLIDQPPTGQLAAATPASIRSELQPGDAAHPIAQLIWPIDQVPVNGARLLKYRLPVYQVFMSANSNSLVVSEKILPGTGKVQYQYELTITNQGSPLEAVLEVYDGRLTLPDVLPIGTVQIRSSAGATRTVPALEPRKLAAPDRYQWSLGQLNSSDTAILRYEV